MATVSITVTAVNDAPVAVDDAYSATEDTALTITAPGLLANDTDVDTLLAGLTAALGAGPANGSVTVNGDGSFTYTPNANFNGTDTFSYTVSDGSSTDSGSVSITVTAVNDAPVAVNNSYSTNEDTALTVTAPGVLGNDSDAEGNTLTAILVAGPANGSLTLNADGSFTYTPNANYNGADSFTYKANDGVVDSNTATVSITVTAVNDAPVAVDNTYSTNEDTQLVVNVASGVRANDTDVDTPLAGLTASVVTGPSNGSLTLNADGSFTYTPNANYNGADSFTYKVNDGTVDSNTATVSITITAVNDAPVAVNDTYTTNEDAPLSVNAALGVRANDTDIDGNTLTATLVAGPGSGTLSFNADGSFTYTPALNFYGAVTFTYKVNDGTADSNTATVTINVNAAPVATGQNVHIPFATGLPLRYKVSGVSLTGNVSDVETPDSGLTWILVSGPTKQSGLGGNGTLTWHANGTFDYNSDDANLKTVTFTYRVVDPQGATSATVTVLIKCGGFAP